MSSDEAIRRHLRTHGLRINPDGHEAAAPRRLVPLDRTEALQLLGTVSFGRIVFTRHALPAIRPVNHLMDGDTIVLRTHEGAALTALVRGAEGQGAVVAYEADVIDPDAHLGWSVVVTGYATAVTEPHELAAYRVRLRPWVHGRMDCAVRIRPVEVTGFRLVPEPADVGPE